MKRKFLGFQTKDGQTKVPRVKVARWLNQELNNVD